eukprot:1104601-Heterocapsa_arctica.AAC.1
MQARCPPEASRRCSVSFRSVPKKLGSNAYLSVSSPRPCLPRNPRRMFQDSAAGFRPKEN